MPLLVHQMQCTSQKFLTPNHFADHCTLGGRRQYSKTRTQITTKLIPVLWRGFKVNASGRSSRYNAYCSPFRNLKQKDRPTMFEQSRPSSGYFDFSTTGLYSSPRFCFNLELVLRFFVLVSFAPESAESVDLVRFVALLGACTTFDGFTCPCGPFLV